MLSYSNSNLTLYLSSNTPSDYTLNDFYAPFSLTIDPRKMSYLGNIRKIEYIWNDEITETVNYKPTPNNEINYALAFPSDVGNPLNYPKTKIFYSNDLNLSTYTVTVNFYCFNVLNMVKSFNLTLNLKNPDIAYTGDSSYFTQIHLIKSKMYGLDDKILYTFQTQGDEYILMANVNWKLKQIKLPSMIETLSLPYNLLKPFETNYLSNTAINTLPIS